VSGSSSEKTDSGTGFARSFFEFSYTDKTTFLEFAQKSCGKGFAFHLFGKNEIFGSDTSWTVCNTTTNKDWSILGAVASIACSLLAVDLFGTAINFTTS
jgi:hypothetical protein